MPDPLDALFTLPMGAHVKVVRKSDGEKIVVRVAGRRVSQDKHGTARYYTLAGAGGSVSYPARQIEDAPQ